MGPRSAVQSLRPGSSAPGKPSSVATVPFTPRTVDASGVQPSLQ